MQLKTVWVCPAPLGPMMAVISRGLPVNENRRRPAAAEANGEVLDLDKGRRVFHGATVVEPGKPESPRLRDGHQGRAGGKTMIQNKASPKASMR